MHSFWSCTFSLPNFLAKRLSWIVSASWLMCLSTCRHLSLGLGCCGCLWGCCFWFCGLFWAVRWPSNSRLLARHFIHSEGIFTVCIPTIFFQKNQAMFALSLPFPSVLQPKHVSSDAQRAPQTPQSILSISGLLGALLHFRAWRGPLTWRSPGCGPASAVGPARSAGAD